MIDAEINTGIRISGFKEIDFGIKVGIKTSRSQICTSCKLRIVKCTVVGMVISVMKRQKCLKCRCQEVLVRM